MADQFINAWSRDFQEVHGAVAKSIAKPPPVSPELLRQLAMQQAAAKASSSDAVLLHLNKKNRRINIDEHFIINGLE